MCRGESVITEHNCREFKQTLANEQGNFCFATTYNKLGSCIIAIARQNKRDLGTLEVILLIVT